MKNPSEIIHQDYLVLSSREDGLCYHMADLNVPNVPGNCFFGHTPLWDGEKFLDCVSFTHTHGGRSYAIKNTPENRATLARCAVGQGFRIL